MTSTTLSAEELFELTGYKRSTNQLAILHRRGFSRAYIGRRGLILERVHFDAICSGQSAPPKPRSANLQFFGAGK